MFHGHLDYFQKSPFGGKPNTKPGDHGTPNAHNRWFILLYHVWRSTWIKIHWINIWLRAWSHMTSHSTWESVTTLHDFGGVLGRPWDTLTISWSRPWLVCKVALNDNAVIWIPPRTKDRMPHIHSASRRGPGGGVILYRWRKKDVPRG